MADTARQADGGTPTVPGYSGLELISRGSTAKVYRATQDRLNRLVAIKVLRVDDELTTAAQVRQELETTVALSAMPHIVSIIDTGSTDAGRPYIVMEYCEDGSYGHILAKTGPLPVHEIVDVGVKVAEALQAAHAVGIIHRDVKPHNVLRSKYGPQLTDFGIARASGDLSGTITLNKLTPQHASPEALRRQAQGPSSDIYSLASTMWNLLVGFPPFADPGDNSPDPFVYRDRALRDPLPPMPRPDVAPAVQDEIARAMAKAPYERHRSAADFADALRRAWSRTTGQPWTPPAEYRPLTGGADTGRTPSGMTGHAASTGFAANTAAPGSTASPGSTGPGGAAASGHGTAPGRPAATGPTPAGDPAAGRPAGSGAFTDQLAPPVQPGPRPSPAQPGAQPLQPGADPAPGMLAGSASPAAPPPAAPTPPPVSPAMPVSPGPAPPATAPPGTAPPEGLAGTAPVSATPLPASDAPAFPPDAAYQPPGRFPAAPVPVPPPPGPAPAPADPDTARPQRRRVSIWPFVAAAVAGVLIGLGVLVALRLAGNTNPPAEARGTPTPTVAASEDPSIAPTDVTLADHQTWVQLSWRDPTHGKALFFVVGGPAGTTPGQLSQPAHGTSRRIDGLRADVDYCFNVMSMLSVDQVSPSERVCTSR